MIADKSVIFHKKKHPGDIRILSLDPGTQITGWAMSALLPNDHIFYVHKFGKITPMRDAQKLYKEDCYKYTPQLIALEHLQNEVSDLIGKWEPDYLVSEDVFLHHRYVNAHAALTLCVHAISIAGRKKGLNCRRIPPLLVKKLISNHGLADKTMVQAAIMSRTDIQIRDTLQSPCSDMSEHEADAIAVGYAFYQSMPKL